MSGQLAVSPAAVIVYQLKAAGVASLYGEGSTWPAAIGQEHNKPDNFITVFDPGSEEQGSLQQTGEAVETYAVQVRVRSIKSNTG